MSNENRRRTIVVNKPVQNRIVLATTWAPVLCLMLTAILLGHYASRMSQETQSEGNSSLLPLLLLGFLLVSAALFVFNALSFSHKVAGPGYHIGKVLHAVREGRLDERIHLRQGDFLTEVAGEINDFLDWLQEHPPQAGSATATAAQGAPAATPAETPATTSATD